MMSKSITIPVRTQGADKAARQLGKVDKGLSRIAKGAAGAAAAFFAARGLINAFNSVIQATEAQILAEAQLNAALKSTQGVAGLTAKELTNMASALQKQTRFGDEAIINAQSLLLTFTKVGKEVFPDAIETVLNMSEAMGQDLQQGVIQVGKALNDPVLGVTALRRVGVQLSKQQEQQVKDFVKVGDVASAQKIILSELETQFGGVAKAAGETLAGSLAKMQNAVGDAQESLGQTLSPAIIAIAKGFTSAANATGDFFKRLRETDLETRIRELSELGIETRKLETLRLQITQQTLQLELRGKREITKVNEDNVKLEQDIEVAKEKSRVAEENIAKLKLEGNFETDKALEKTGIIIQQKTEEGIEAEKIANQAERNLNNLLQQQLANAVLLGQYEEVKLIQEQIARLTQEAKDAGGEGGEAEEKKTKASDDFKKNSKEASVSLAASAVQGKDMENAQKEFTKSVGLAVIKLAAQLIIEKAITNEKRKQAALATAGKIFGFGFATGGSFTNRFAGGGSFNVNKRTILPTNPPALVGDNASGAERIDVTPLPAAPSSNGRNITINISAPLVDETVVDTIIPAIRRAEKLGL
jgi:phage-related minor tail protein